MEGIEELIELFRRSGGKFENAALGYREEAGFYVYTLDSNLDTVVLCPSHLLVDINDIGISEDGFFISSPGKYENNMEFLEKYVAFHFNRKMLDQYLQKKQDIDSLSSKDLSLISRIYTPNLCWSGGIEGLEFAKMQMLKSHQIQYFGASVLMPFVTFLNHAKDGRPYDIQKDSISVSGKFSDEVFAIYHMGDTLEIAGCHGFVADTRFAYSLSMLKKTTTGRQVIIDRSLESTSTREGFRWPLVQKDRSTVKIGWFPLYFERDPLYPAKVAQLVASETGLPAEVFLNDVFSFNLNVLVPVAFQLRDSENPYARLVAAAAQRQLEVIGGTRR